MADACFLLIFIIITESGTTDDPAPLWRTELWMIMSNGSPSFSRSLNWRATEIKAIVRRVIPHFELSHVVETNVVIFLVSNARFALRVPLVSNQFYVTK